MLCVSAHCTCKRVRHCNHLMCQWRCWKCNFIYIEPLNFSLEKCMSHQDCEGVFCFSVRFCDELSISSFVSLHFYAHGNRFSTLEFQCKCTCGCVFVSADRNKFRIWPQWASNLFLLIYHTREFAKWKKTKLNNVTHFAKEIILCLTHAKSSVNTEQVNQTKWNDILFRVWMCECAI